MSKLILSPAFMRIMLSSCLVSILITMCTGLQAKEFHWSGAVDNNWYNPNNWKEGAVPSDDSNITISNVPSKNYPIFKGMASVNKLTIATNGKLKVDIAGILNANRLINQGMLFGEGTIDANHCLINYGIVESVLLYANIICIQNSGIIYTGDIMDFDELGEEFLSETEN